MTKVVKDLQRGIQKNDYSKLVDAIARAEELPGFQPEELGRAKEQLPKAQAVLNLKRALETNTLDSLQAAVDNAKKIRGYNPSELGRAEEAIKPLKVVARACESVCVRACVCVCVFIKPH